MRNGRIVQTGTVQDIVLRPADDYVAEFVRRMNPLKVLTGAMVMRAASGWSAAMARCSWTRRDAIASGSTPAMPPPSCMSTGRPIHCAQWTTTRPAGTTSGRSSSRPPRSRCRDSFTCAAARDTPCCLPTAGGCWVSRAKRRSSGAFGGAAAQGRLHEERIRGCRPHAHAGRGLHGRPGHRRRACRHRRLRPAGPPRRARPRPGEHAAGVHARARDRRDDARARLRRHERRRASS